MESASFLKLACDGGEIDFIVAPSLTDEPFIEETIDGRTVHVETPVEISVKKAFYRAADLRARDVFDLAVTSERDREGLLRNASVLGSKKALLIARLHILERTYHAAAAREIAVLPAGERYLENAPAMVLRFIQSL